MWYMRHTDLGLKLLLAALQAFLPTPSSAAALIGKCAAVCTATLALAAHTLLVRPFAPAHAWKGPVYAALLVLAAACAAVNAWAGALDLGLLGGPGAHVLRCRQGPMQCWSSRCSCSSRWSVALVESWCGVPVLRKHARHQSGMQSQTLPNHATDHASPPSTMDYVRRVIAPAVATSESHSLSAPQLLPMGNAALSHDDSLLTAQPSAEASASVISSSVVSRCDDGMHEHAQYEYLRVC